MPKKNPVTVIRLARPVEDGTRMVDTVIFSGEPGCYPLPITKKGDDFEIDMIELQRVVAMRTGLSEPAVHRMSGLDFFGVYFALFVSRRKG